MSRKKRFDKLATFMIKKEEWENLHRVAESRGIETSQLLRELVSKEIKRSSNQQRR